MLKLWNWHFMDIVQSHRHRYTCTCQLWPFSGILGLAEAQCCVYSLLAVADEDAELANGCRHYLALAHPVMKCLHDRLHEAASHI